MWKPGSRARLCSPPCSSSSRLLVVIQLWLVAAALDALLARQFAVLVPTAIASGVLFALSGGLLWYVGVVRRAAPPLGSAWLTAPAATAARRPRPGGRRGASRRDSRSRTC